MKVKLRPCPFCGSNELYTGPCGDGGRCVQCLNCNAKIAIPLPCEGRGTLKAVEKRCLKEAIRRWNKRTGDKIIE